MRFWQNTPRRKNRLAKQTLWLTSTVAADGQTVNLGSNERKQIQRSLSYLGFDVGAVDGQFGPKTISAISAARFMLGLTPSSEVDVTTLRKLPNVNAIDALKSIKAKPYRDIDIPEALEPRLEKALEVFSYYRFKFDYFEGHHFILSQAKAS